MRRANRLAILTVAAISATTTLMNTPALADDIPQELIPTTVEVTSEDIAEPNAGGVGATCASKQVSVYYKNYTGTKLFTFYQKLSWCMKSGKITSASSDAWGTPNAAAWVWKGVQKKTISGGVGSTSWTVFRQGKFCIDANVVCFSEKWPWIEQKVKSGSHTYRTGV